MLVVARCLEAERTPVVKRTSGHRCRALDRRGTLGVREACGMVSWARGGRAVAGNGTLTWRKPAVGKSLHRGCWLAVCARRGYYTSRGRRRSHFLAWMATRSGGQLWRWRAETPEVIELSRGKGRCEESRGKQNGSRTPPLSCPRPDKPDAPTWVGNDQR
jgi:hypothetical protein